MVVVWVCFMCPVVVLCPAPAPALHLRSVMATQTFLPFPNVTWFLAPSWTRYLFSLECLPLLSFLGTSLSYIQDPGASLDSTLEPFIHISFTGTFLHCPMVVYRLVSPIGCWSPREKGCFLSFIDSWAPTQILGMVVHWMTRPGKQLWKGECHTGNWCCQVLDITGYHTACF